MIPHYFKIAWRTMVKDKTYATINIIGLTIGLCACMLVFTVVIDELSYDRFWKRADDLYRVVMVDRMAEETYSRRASTPVGLGYALRDNFPEMEQCSAVSTSELRLQIGEDNNDGVALQVILADTNAFQLLDFHPLSGRLPFFVAGFQNLLITESFRDKHFNGADPVGQIIKDVPSWSGEVQTYVITGVIKDLPANTHLRAEALVLTEPRDGRDFTSAGIRGGTNVYYLLQPGTDAQVFTNKMNNWFQNYMEAASDKRIQFELQPITAAYLHTDFHQYINIKGDIRTVYILSGVGALLLLIACINFVNLSLARAMKRLKELGVRKVLGAERRQLAIQFVVESLLLFAIGSCVATGLYALGIPVIEAFIGHGLSQNMLSNAPIFALTLLVILLVSLVTGAYPAWLISGFKPANTLRGKLVQQAALSAQNLRKALVVAQFTISIVVLVGLLVVRYQLEHLAKTDIGYQRENLLHIGLRSWQGKGQAFKHELARQPGIKSASIAGWDLINGGTSMSGTIDHPIRDGEKIEIDYINADFDFAQTLGIQLQSGRHLDAAHGTDVFVGLPTPDSTSSVITTTTARLLGIGNVNSPTPKIGHNVVGILKDFHQRSLHHALTPVFILGDPNPDYAYLFIRTIPGMQQQAQQSLVKVWKDFYPNRLLDARWVTDILDKQYESERKQQTLFSFFSGLMLFLSAMGVLGLIVHAAQQRQKEIGIRKVLGAPISAIVRLLSTDFVKLVLLAAMIASPIAWWMMSKWLEDFAYRISIQWWMFTLAGLIAVSITLLTVGWQAIRAAVANPVDSLRDE